VMLRQLEEGFSLRVIQAGSWMRDFYLARWCKISGWGISTLAGFSSGSWMSDSCLAEWCNISGWGIPTLAGFSWGSWKMDSYFSWMRDAEVAGRGFPTSAGWYWGSWMKASQTTLWKSGNFSPQKSHIPRYKIENVRTFVKFSMNKKERSIYVYIYTVYMYI
jgi:hypothetical protein